jgi:hypothetical protein
MTASHYADPRQRAIGESKSPENCNQKPRHPSKHKLEKGCDMAIYQRRVAALARAGSWRCSFRSANPPHAPRRFGSWAVRAASRRAGGDDYAFVPPTTPSSSTDRLCILVVLKNSPAFLKEQGSIFRAFRVETFTLAHILRLHNEPFDDTIRK